MTNIERIKAMSVEEMARFINEISNCEINICEFCPLIGYCGSDDSVKKYLESEVEEE